MIFRFYINPETDRPHVEDHGITVDEVVEVMERPGQDYMGDRGARIALGRTNAGRYIKVIYVPDEPTAGTEDSVFVITAYPLTAKQLAAFKKRIRNR